jgi:ABC-type multidrug transport system fused ATPase/permease subunit
MEAIRVYLVNRFNQVSQNRIFEKMTRNLFRAPINEFFERVPIGRILNRYSEDMTIADNQLP